eukprot:10628842-Heterocapsa_arctica.AAC.1
MVEGWRSLEPTGLMNPRAFPCCGGKGQSLATTEEILSSGCPRRPALPLGGVAGQAPGAWPRLGKVPTAWPSSGDRERVRKNNRGGQSMSCSPQQV